MTSQTLLQTRLSESSAPQAVSCEADTSKQSSKAQAGKSAALPEVNKLPYQANHQAELLHLRAETEALLHHLQLMIQQRTIAPEDDLVAADSRSLN